METGAAATIWISISTLVALVLNLAYQWYSKDRERRWTLEAAEKLERAAKEAAATLSAEVVAGSNKAVEGSEKAYTEANTVNQKIAALQEQNAEFNKVLVKLSDHIGGIVASIQETTAATKQASLINAKVEEALRARDRGRGHR